jgi:hypothetical protein
LDIDLSMDTSDDDEPSPGPGNGKTGNRYGFRGSLLSGSPNSLDSMTSSGYVKRRSTKPDAIEVIEID